MQAIESAGPQCHGHSHLTDEPAAVVGRGWRQQPTVTLKTPERVVQDERKVQNVSSYRRTGPIEEQRCSLRFGLKVTLAVYFRTTKTHTGNPAIVAE